MESYWDFYVSYVHKCVADNWANDIDPAHYDMEWNHFLPKCVFGDQPIGQWLTLKQHAIATALQTLALKKCCLFGSHLSLLPEKLHELVYPGFVARSVENGKKVGKVRGEILGRENVILQRGFLDPANKELVRAGSIKGGRKTGPLEGRKNVEEGRGIWDPSNQQKRSEWASKGGTNVNKQKWKSTKDGYISTACGVATHNIARGWDSAAKVQIND